MAAYCTVQEAWGPSFAPTSINYSSQTLTPPRTQEQFTSSTGYDASRDMTNSMYQEVNSPRRQYIGEKYHDPKVRERHDLGKSDNCTGAPYGKENYQYSTVDENAGKEHILNYSHTYDEEPQLDVGAYKRQCGSAFSHLIECSDCRKRLLNSIMSLKPAVPHQQPQQSTTDSMDLTELALFIACGIFFLFLLDAIMRLTSLRK